MSWISVLLQPRLPARGRRRDRRAHGASERLHARSDAGGRGAAALVVCWHAVAAKSMAAIGKYHRISCHNSWSHKISTFRQYGTEGWKNIPRIKVF